VSLLPGFLFWEDIRTLICWLDWWLLNLFRGEIECGSLFFKQEMELSLIGLQNAGKTSLVNVIAVSSFNFFAKYNARQSVVSNWELCVFLFCAVIYLWHEIIALFILICSIITNIFSFLTSYAWRRRSCALELTFMVERFVYPKIHILFIVVGVLSLFMLCSLFGWCASIVQTGGYSEDMIPTVSVLIFSCLIFYCRGHLIGYCW